MNNFDLKKFLVENKLTTNSKTLVKEAMSMNDLDPMKIVTDEYLAQKGIKVNPSENGSGQRVLDMLNPPHVSTIETDEDEAGAESYDVYDLGDGHFLVIDDYEGLFAIYRKNGGIKAAKGTYPEELAEYDIESTGEEEIIYEVEVLGEDGKVKSYTKLRADKFDLYIKNRPLPVTIKFNNRTVRAGTKITKVTDDMGRPMNL
jgi:hypothetical protein